MKNRSLLIVIILFFNCGLIAQTYTLDGNLIITETTEMESDAEINGDLKVNTLSGVSPSFNTNLVFRDDNGKFLKGTWQMWYTGIYPTNFDCYANSPFWSNSGNANELHVGSDCTNGVRIGIGTDSPDAELDVNGSGDFAQNIGIGIPNDPLAQLLVKPTSNLVEVGICIDTSNQLDWNYGMKVLAESLNNKALAVNSANSGDDTFLVMGDGRVFATSIAVRLEGTFFPDYVFEDDYDLMSLYDLQKFIEINKHLPKMPTADKVATDGIDLGEMDRLLTE